MYNLDGVLTPQIIEGYNQELLKQQQKDFAKAKKEAFRRNAHWSFVFGVLFFATAFVALSIQILGFVSQLESWPVGVKIGLNLAGIVLSFLVTGYIAIIVEQLLFGLLERVRNQSGFKPQPFALKEPLCYFKTLTNFDQDGIKIRMIAKNGVQIFYQKFSEQQEIAALEEIEVFKNLCTQANAMLHREAIKIQTAHEQAEAAREQKAQEDEALKERLARAAQKP